MTSTREISAEVDAISAAIQRALDSGGTIDVCAVEERVGKLCGQLGTLDGGEGAALRPRLEALIEEFARLGTLIETRLENMRGDLGPVDT